MKKMLWLAGGALALGACSHGPPSPKLQFETVGYVLTLPPGMQQALNAVAPGFQTVRIDHFRSDIAQSAALSGGGLQAMFATIGDFDGNGSKDVVVEGAAPGDSALQVIAIMNGAKPKAIEVTRFPVYDADAVGVYLSKPTGGRKGAFEVMDYPYTSMLYRYQGGRFVGTKIGS